LVQASFAGVTGCGDCTVPSLPIWFLADGACSATRVGRANQVSPAATAGAVWLTSYPADRRSGHCGTDGAGGQPGGRAAEAAGQAPDRVRDLSGNRPRPVARAGPPAAGTPAYELWNPADPQASRTFDGVIAASPAEIAWTLQPTEIACREHEHGHKLDIVVTDDPSPTGRISAIVGGQGDHRPCRCGPAPTA
jgi:hypothetical protein